MSQRDLWSRGAAALLRECYPATGGVLCPPLGLCGQTWRCTSTKLSNMGRHSQQPWMLVDLWSKSITISCSHRSKRQPGSHILSTSTWQIHSQSMPMWSTILLPISKRLPFTAPLNHLNLLTAICWTSERPSDEIDGKCQNLLLMKDRYCCARVGDTTRQAERQRLTQLSKWLFVAPCVLCLREIINCIIRTPVIHTLFVPATVQPGCKKRNICSTQKRSARVRYIFWLMEIEKKKSQENIIFKPGSPQQYINVSFYTFFCAQQYSTVNSGPLLLLYWHNSSHLYIYTYSWWEINSAQHVY